MTVPREPAPGSGPDRSSPRPAGGPPGAPVELSVKLERSWTWILAAALASLVPGVLILVWPDETLHVLAVLIGLHLIVAGALRFVGVFAREEAGERLTGLLLSVLYVLGGVLCLRHPLQTIAALSLITGIVWLASGILTLYTAVAARNLPHRGAVLGAGLLGLVAGIVVLALPMESALALTRLLGLWLVLLGLVEAAVAFAARAASDGPRTTGPGSGAAGPG
ncbi:HdeD family acid-resistance protein [Streptomyces sp. NPDC016309]|uniref:HdeD family acid-resistance protein n=1 Tax=Streptomyces sp. NPDC016309 TaxID=3364965 RepID=UPI0036F8C593